MYNVHINNQNHKANESGLGNLLLDIIVSRGSFYFVIKSIIEE